MSGKNKNSEHKLTKFGQLKFGKPSPVLFFFFCQFSTARVYALNSPRPKIPPICFMKHLWMKENK